MQDYRSFGSQNTIDLENLQMDCGACFKLQQRYSPKFKSRIVYLKNACSQGLCCDKQYIVNKMEFGDQGKQIYVIYEKKLCKRCKKCESLKFCKIRHLLVDMKKFTTECKYCKINFLWYELSKNHVSSSAQSIAKCDFCKHSFCKKCGQIPEMFNQNNNFIGNFCSECRERHYHPILGLLRGIQHLMQGICCIFVFVVYGSLALIFTILAILIFLQFIFFYEYYLISAEVYHRMKIEIRNPWAKIIIYPFWLIFYIIITCVVFAILAIPCYFYYTRKFVLSISNIRVARAPENPQNQEVQQEVIEMEMHEVLFENQNQQRARLQGELQQLPI